MSKPIIVQIENTSDSGEEVRVQVQSIDDFGEYHCHSDTIFATVMVEPADKIMAKLEKGNRIVISRKSGHD